MYHPSDEVTNGWTPASTYAKIREAPTPSSLLVMVHWRAHSQKYLAVGGLDQTVALSSPVPVWAERAHPTGHLRPVEIKVTSPRLFNRYWDADYLLCPCYQAPHPLNRKGNHRAAIVRIYSRGQVTIELSRNNILRSEMLISNIGSRWSWDGVIVILCSDPLHPL